MIRHSSAKHLITGALSQSETVFLIVCGEPLRHFLLLPSPAHRHNLRYQQTASPHIQIFIYVPHPFSSVGGIAAGYPDNVRWNAKPVYKFQKIGIFAHNDGSGFPGFIEYGSV